LFDILEIFYMRPLEILIDFLSYDGTLTNDPADGTKIKNRIQETSVNSVVRTQIPLADATSDVALTLPASPSEYLLIFCDREITLKLNGSDDEVTLKPRANGIKTFVFFTRGEVESALVSNNSGAIANLDVISVKK